MTSVLKQTWRDLEVIVVDDGSTDETRQVVSAFAESFNYKYQPNSGRSVARNHGFEISRGEYICFLDSDDLFVPQKLERQVTLLESRPDVGFVYCDYEFIDHNGNLLPKPAIYQSHPLQRGAICRHLLAFDFIPLPTILVRRQVLKVDSSFDSSVEPAEDFDWLLRLAARSDTEFVPDPLCQFRVHPGNSSADGIGYSTMRILVKHLDSGSLKPALGSSWRAAYHEGYSRAATWYYHCGKIGMARTYFLKALRAGGWQQRDARTFKSFIKSVAGTQLSMLFKSM